jgi:nucleotidyltransferase/DNA polymerase involved in DNA repair
MQYDPEKSHLSAELKAQFLQNCSLDSPTKAIPGVGSVTAERLAEKDIHTVGELLEATDSFLAMKALVGRVNAHKIFDALEPLRRKRPPTTASVVPVAPAAPAAPAADQTEFLVKEMKKIGLVESDDDRDLEKDISSCVII